MSMKATYTNIAVTPTFAVPTAHEAIARGSPGFLNEQGRASKPPFLCVSSCRRYGKPTRCSVAHSHW
jgi:hypothetical protein